MRFRGLRQFIESLPQDSALLVGERTSMGRWKAVAGRNSDYADSAFGAHCENKARVLPSVECGMMEVCQGGWPYYAVAPREIA